MIKLGTFDKGKKITLCEETACNFCQCDKNLSDEYYEDKPIKTCFLCRIVMANKKEDVYRCLLVHSSLSQLDIIKATRKYYEKHGTIPFPQQLDPGVQMANLPVYTFSKFPDKSKFENIVVYFTANVQDFMEDEIELQFKISKKKEPILKYYEIPKYYFSTEQQESIENQINIVRPTLKC